MAVDEQLLEILICPHCQGELTLIELPAASRLRLVEKYREHFQGEDPVVEQGLHCAASNLIYPIVSDIPIMLVDDALPDSVLTGRVPTTDASTVDDSTATDRARGS